MLLIRLHAKKHIKYGGEEMKKIIVVFGVLLGALAFYYRKEIKIILGK
jgi:hypothetical protein